MAIALRAVGAQSATFGASVTLALPVGWQAGDLHVMVIGCKYDTTAINTPTGWDRALEITGGAGAAGVDTGTVRAVVFNRVAQAGDANQLVNWAPNPSPLLGAIIGYSKGVGDPAWETPIVGATAADTTGSATSYGTVTGSQTVALSTGDWFGQFTIFNGDAGTPGTRTLTVPGVTLGTYVTHFNDAGTTSSDDARWDVGTAPYSSGSASGAPTLARTWTTGNASFAGATVFFRLRAASATPPPVWARVATSNPALHRASRW